MSEEKALWIVCLILFGIGVPCCTYLIQQDNALDAQNLSICIAKGHTPIDCRRGIRGGN